MDGIRYGGIGQRTGRRRAQLKVTESAVAQTVTAVEPVGDGGGERDLQLGASLATFLP